MAIAPQTGFLKASAIWQPGSMPSSVDSRYVSAGEEGAVQVTASGVSVGPCNPLHAPYFAYKALKYKDTLHIKH